VNRAAKKGFWAVVGAAGIAALVAACKNDKENWVPVAVGVGIIATLFSLDQLFGTDSNGVEDDEEVYVFVNESDDMHSCFFDCDDSVGMLDPQFWPPYHSGFGCYPVEKKEYNQIVINNTTNIEYAEKVKVNVEGSEGSVIKASDVTVVDDCRDHCLSAPEDIISMWTV